MPEQSVSEQIEAMLSIGEPEPEPEPDPVEPDPDPIDPEPDPDPIKDPDPDPEPEPVVDPEPEPDPDPDPSPDPDPEPEPDPPVDDELKKIKEENEKLREQIEKSHSPKLEDPEPLKVEPAPEPEPIKDIEFIESGVDLDELTRDPKAFNALLNKVHAMGVESQRTYQEGTLKSIPDIVKNNVAIQATLTKGVEKFYSDNKDLKSFSKVCANVYEELASENPDWTVTKTFEEVGKEARNRLELQKKTDDPAEPDPDPKPDPIKNPKFAKTRSRREPQKPKTESLLTEIDAMNKDI